MKALSNKQQARIAYLDGQDKIFYVFFLYQCKNMLIFHLKFSKFQSNNFHFKHYFNHFQHFKTSKSVSLFYFQKISQTSFINYDVTVITIIVKMFVKTVVLLAILAIALSQISTIINCVQPDLVNYRCITCKPYFQNTAGQCRQCLIGYTLVGGNCVLSSTVTATTSSTTTTRNTPPTPTPQNTQTTTQTNANTATTVSQLNSILQIIAANPALAGQLKPIVLQLLAINTPTAPATSPTNIPGLTTVPSKSTTTTSSSTVPSKTATTTSSTTFTPSTTLTTSTPSTNSATSSTTTQSTGGSNVFLPFFASQTTPAGSVAMTSTTANARLRPSQTDWNCKRLNQFNMFCAQCYTGFYVNPLTQTCMAVNPNCQNVTSNNLCLSCYQGYTLINGNCIVTPQNPLSNKCKTILRGICQQCYTGYYLNYSTNTCDTANPNCKSITILNKCSSCYQGYMLVNQDCIIADSSDQDWQYTDSNCKTYDDNRFCIQCVQRFVLDQNGRCMMVDPFCQDYTETGECLLCYIGYKISNGACTLLTNGPITPTDDWIQCPFRTVPRPGQCLQVSDQCNTWSDVTGLCQSCYLGYDLTIDGQCIISS